MKAPQAGAIVGLAGQSPTEPGDLDRRDQPGERFARFGAELGIGITGVAGPDGGSPDKPVGTVCFAWARKGAPARSETRRFAGGRESVRKQSAIHALQGLLELLDSAP